MSVISGAATLLFLLGGVAAGAQVVDTAPVADSAQAHPTADAAETQAMPQSVSQVRIVRLSQVRGAVQLDRHIGRGFEDAFANIPVVNGSKLSTGDGVAEIEFEDNSTLRLAPGTKVSFEQLGRSSSGATLSRVKIVQGTVYVSLAKTKDNLFMLEDGQARILVSPGTHLRLQAGEVQAAEALDARAHLAVFEGEAQVETATGPTGVLKKQTLLFDPESVTAPAVMAKTEPAEADSWDKSQNDYHRGNSGFTGSGLAPGAGLYGGNDLNYYGQFSNVSGCGSVWRPYFTGAGWDPFANGALAYYQGAGYSWVSPYPWGWLPFHTGAWQLCGGGVWGWRPGGQWYGLGNTTLHKTPALLPHLPVRPGPHEPTLLQVNAKPIAPSGISQSETFTFRSGSAGLGVPREGFGKLSGLSASVERHGSVSSPVYVASSGISGNKGSSSGGVLSQAVAGNAMRSSFAASGGSSAMSHSVASSSSSAGASHSTGGGGSSGGHR